MGKVLGSWEQRMWPTVALSSTASLEIAIIVTFRSIEWVGGERCTVT